ncbi:hypothetical protein CR513_46955, partial [Mucuna pruriens]
MCTDYTDLNKAYPKDPYPLPNIDRLVDGASGHDLLSSIDAYSRYNQIRMHLMDEVKIAFITDEDNFCYQGHPSEIDELNIQRPEGLDVEVSVDDMVAKSAQGEQHCTVFTRVFDVLRKHNLKLNVETLKPTWINVRSSSIWVAQLV